MENNEALQDAQVNLIAWVSLVLVISFLLPDYANAKYTIFTLPFFFSYVIRFSLKISIFAFSLIILNFVVILNLILLRL